MTPLVLSLAVLGVMVQPPKPNVKEIEERAIQAREKIRSARVSLRLESNVYESGAIKESTRSTATIWQSGTKIRADVIRDGGTFAGFRTVDCLNCDKDGWGIRANDKPQMATTVFRLGGTGAELRDAIDPRLLGYSPRSFAALRDARLDGTVGRPDRDEPVVTSERLNGLDCWVIRWTNTNGARVSVWVCPSQGDNVFRVEVRSPSEQKPEHVQAVFTELSQSQPSGLWFPKRVIYEDRPGGDLRRREVVDITELHLNEAIPPETFTLDGIKLRLGAYISDQSERKRSGFWDPATQTITPPSPPASLFQPSKPATPVDISSRPTNYWLVAASAGCAVAAITIVLLRRRSVAS